MEENMASRSQPSGAPKSAASQLSTTVDEIIGNLCDQIERAEDKAARWGQELMAARKRANDAERRHLEAIRALRPFAEIARSIGCGWSDERRASSLSIDPLKVGDLRRALALVLAADAANSTDEAAK